MSSILNTNYYSCLQANKTAIVQVYKLASNSTNDDYYYYRCRNCDTNLTTNTLASQYQKQKIIQNTVSIDSSQYTMNLASLASYQNPTKSNVPWNQMSDRAVPAKQKASANGGNIIGSSTTRNSVTRLRPGSMSPGGIGCDIKHNSYERYLNRLKGKGPLRRGEISLNFGIKEIRFNRASPVYGNKLCKTSIISGCNCTIVANKNNDNQMK
jgi:hypothetical protein